MSRLIARLVPPVLLVGGVAGLWYFVFRLALDHAVAVIARA
jgi:hypothetical protein